MEAILMKIYEYYTGEERNMLLHAYDYAKAAHANQKRASGEPYFIHPCAVAEILVDLGLDPATIAAALLHDVIEDTPVTEEDIRREFGEEVLSLVAGVTKLDKIVFKSQEEEEAENFRKLFIAMAKDIRVIIIKLADRLHNMRSLNFLSKERQQRMARETLDIYTPIAGRLGISQVKCELEDLCLKYLDPEAFEYLVENIHQKLEERNRFVDYVVEEIKKILVECNIHGEVFGRPKHFYSIYKKMTTKNKTLDQIVGFPLRLDDLPGLHRMRADRLVKILPVAARADRLHQDVLRRHEGELRHDVSLNHLRPDLNAVADVRDERQNHIRGKECLP